MDHWVIYVRRPKKSGGRGARKPRAQGYASSAHDAIRADGCNFRKGEGGRWPRKYVTSGGVEITAERRDPIEGVRDLRNPRGKQSA